MTSFLKGVKFHLVTSDKLLQDYFTDLGAVHTDKVFDADFALFPGGEDVAPFLYGQMAHETTHSNFKRDRKEVRTFKSLPSDIHKVGICRGSQFLCVMGGGTLWQDVDGHCGEHMLTDVRTGELRSTTSTHHQMMAPPDHALILATAGETTYKSSDVVTVTQDHSRHEQDIEALFIEQTNSLCFQGHPEYGNEDCSQYFQDLLAEHLEGVIVCAD
jgi:gamma-glutamyl-gamma-aminobutyrate hydrolase PuuD